MRTSYFFEKSGHEFESRLVDVVLSAATREWGTKSVKFSTSKQDVYEGTDLFVLGVPIDVTLAFAKKNHTRQVGSLQIDGVTVDLGVRYGNGKAIFETPVLVIGAETAVGITKSNMWVALDTIKTHIKDILETGMDEYLLATEA